LDDNVETKLEAIKQTILLEAPIQKVWKQVASAEGIEAWFMPNNFTPEEGSTFTLHTPFGASPCKVLTIEEPNKLSFTWDKDGWIVSFLLKEIDGKTEFTLVHDGWKNPDELLPKANTKTSEVRDRMNHGWSQIILKLREVV
jgi:uncharacterized protein YndB with AHSA1/START domain